MLSIINEVLLVTIQTFMIIVMFLLSRSHLVINECITGLIMMTVTKNTLLIRTDPLGEGNAFC